MQARRREASTNQDQETPLPPPNALELLGLRYRAFDLWPAAGATKEYMQAKVAGKPWGEAPALPAPAPTPPNVPTTEGVPRPVAAAAATAAALAAAAAAGRGEAAKGNGQLPSSIKVFGLCPSLSSVPLPIPSICCSSHLPLLSELNLALSLSQVHTESDGGGTDRRKDSGGRDRDRGGHLQPGGVRAPDRSGLPPGGGQGPGAGPGGLPVPRLPPATQMPGPNEPLKQLPAALGLFINALPQGVCRLPSPPSISLISLLLACCPSQSVVFLHLEHAQLWNTPLLLVIPNKSRLSCWLSPQALISNLMPRCAQPVEGKVPPADLVVDIIMATDIEALAAAAEAEAATPPPVASHPPDSLPQHVQGYQGGAGDDLRGGGMESPGQTVNPGKRKFDGAGGYGGHQPPGHAPDNRPPAFDIYRQRRKQKILGSEASRG